MENYIQEYSHRRFNCLTGEWVLVSPHRAKRPWQGQNEEVNNEQRPLYDKGCYLCPGNVRANGEVNPNYSDVFIFKNDFAALQHNSPSFEINDGLLKASGETGICKVICFSPDHSKSLADMPAEAIQKVVKAWQKEYQELGQEENINYIQIFENKGAVMGCSNPHPHGQIWSQSTLPNEVAKKDSTQKQYYKKKGQSVLLNYLEQEATLKERVLYENENFTILVPFWAIWPFETMIIPKQHQQHILQMSEEQTLDFAKAIGAITKAYDKVFHTSFPYSSGIHQAPTNGENNKHWHWHMSFYPPLLRSATVKKFMVGYEMFGTPQRDITPEKAAETLRLLINN